MRSARPLRVPLQIGASAVFSLARGSAFAVPGLILFGIPLAVVIWAGATDLPDEAAYIFLPGIIVLGFSWKHLKRARDERPSDLLLRDDGFELRGGPHSGARVVWSELTRVSLEQPPKKKDKDEDDSDLRQLCVYRKTPAGEERLQLAAADDSSEQRSLTELARTLEAGFRKGTDSTQRAPAKGDAVDLVVCGGCGAAVVPVDASEARCAFCAALVQMPDEVRKRLRDAADLSRRPDAAVAKLLDQPGAGFVSALLVIGALFMLSAWPVALGLATRNFLEHALSLKGVGFLLLFVAACIAGFFALVRGSLVDRQALRLVALDFGALPPATPGAPYLCRRCLAPLQAQGSEQVLVGCVYCGAENVLGIDLQRDASVAREESRSLTEALARRTSERRRWRGVSLAAVVLIALSAYSLRNGIGHNPITWPLEQRCAQNDLGGCTQLADLISVDSADVQTDRKRATKLYERSCTGGDASACVGLSNLYLDTNRVPGRDVVRAKAYMVRACDLGNLAACERLNPGSWEFR